jgi:acetylornithine deacetylase/succinyl-diaminopimelate desuccinylase-like protein
MADRSSAALASDTHRLLAPSHARLALCDPSLIEDQVTIAQIAAPTGNESERGAWIAQRFASLGLSDVDTDGAGNIVGRRAGTRSLSPIAICAHLDTVFPQGTDLSVRRDGPRLVGPGINDNGRGLAVILALAAELDGRRITTSRSIDFVATTGEEGAGNLRGAKHYFATRGADAYAAIVIDGAGDERIVHRALGSRRFRVTFDGPGGHSWSAFGAPNAVHAAAAATTAITSIALPADPRTTLTVARIGGGLSVNSIPGHAWVEIDLRSSSATILDSIARRVVSAVHEATVAENGRRAADTSELRSRVETIGDRPCGGTAEDHPLVQAAMHVTRLIGRSPELTMASTDANVPISMGIPAVAIGAGGRGGDAHTTAEWYDNTAGPLGVARALTIVVTAACPEASPRAQRGER